MRHLLFAFLAFVGLLFSPATLAQDPPAEAAAAVPEGKAKEGKAKEGKAKAKEGKAKAKEGKAKAKEGKAKEGKAKEGKAKEGKAKAPMTDEEAAATVTALADAIKAGKWPLAVGLFLTLLVYVVNRFALGDKIGEKMIPWVAGGLGASGAAGTALVSGAEVVDAVVVGLAAAVAAVGGWEAVLKHVTAKPPEEESETDPGTTPEA